MSAGGAVFDLPARHFIAHAESTILIFNLPGSALEVVCCAMQDDKGKSKGFGFINFADADGANKAVEGMIGKEVNGKSLYAGR